MRFPLNILTFTGMVLLAIAGGFAWWSWQEIAPTRGWVSTQGRIFRTNIAAVRVSGRSSSGWNYVPEFRFEYEVDGIVYRGDRAWPGTPRRWTYENEVRVFLDDFPPGRPIRVHYNPGRPREAALFLETSFLTSWVFGVVGLLVFLLGWVIEAALGGESRRPAAGLRRKRGKS